MREVVTWITVYGLGGLLAVLAAWEASQFMVDRLTNGG